MKKVNKRHMCIGCSGTPLVISIRPQQRVICLMAALHNGKSDCCGLQGRKQPHCHTSADILLKTRLHCLVNKADVIAGAGCARHRPHHKMDSLWNYSRRHCTRCQCCVHFSCRCSTACHPSQDYFSLFDPVA